MSDVLGRLITIILGAFFPTGALVLVGIVLLLQRDPSDAFLVVCAAITWEYWQQVVRSYGARPVVSAMKYLILLVSWIIFAYGGYVILFAR